jgi:hypothetical protein
MTMTMAAKPPSPMAVCRSDCTRLMREKFSYAEVSNDLLRAFDGITMGDLLESDAVCNWQLLPKGFLLYANGGGGGGGDQEGGGGWTPAI